MVVSDQIEAWCLVRERAGGEEWVSTRLSRRGTLRRSRRWRATESGEGRENEGYMQRAVLGNREGHRRFRMVGGPRAART